MYFHGAWRQWHALGRAAGALSAETIDSLRTALVIQAVGVILLFAAVGQTLTYLKRSATQRDGKDSKTP